MFLFHMSHDPLTDIHVYYDAAASLNARQPLYPPGTRIYPRLLAILFRPLALLPFEFAAAVWERILVGSLGLTLLRIGIRKIFPPAVGIYRLARRDWQHLGRLILWTAGLVLVQFILEPANTWAFPGTLGPRQVASEVGSEGNLSPFVFSPLVWAVVVAIEVAVAFRFAHSRQGWAAAVCLAVLTPPRVFSYNLMKLLACLGGPGKGRARLDPTGISLATRGEPR